MEDKRKENFVNGVKKQIKRIEESRKFLSDLVDKLDEKPGLLSDDINKAAYALTVFNLISADFAVEFHYRVLDKLEEGKLDEIFSQNMEDFEDLMNKIKDPNMMN